jgi:D-amino peptidase
LPLRIFVSVDMEGATGIVQSCQVNNDRPEYAFGCRMQQHDALAVARAALGGGADPVVVADSHDRMINLDISEFPVGVELVSGSHRTLGMLEGSEGADGAFFVAYHAMAGTEKAVLDHTMSGDTVFDVRLNGLRIGETGLNAAVLGQLGVPLALVAGDDATAHEARSLLGDEVVTCVVKEGLGRFAARCLPPLRTSRLLAEAVAEAMARIRAGRAPIFRIEGPYVFDVTFLRSFQADAASQVPGGERMDGRTLRFTTPELLETRRFLNAAIDAAAGA